MAYTGIFPEAFPYLYEEGWHQALQQKSARSRAYVNTIPMNGKSKRFHKIDKIESEVIGARFGDTNPSDVGIDYRKQVSFDERQRIANSTRRFKGLRLG